MKLTPLFFILVVFACHTGNHSDLINQLRRNQGIRLDAERYCILTYNPNDCAVCISGINEIFVQLLKDFPRTGQAVVILPGLREVERRDVLRRAVFSSDTLQRRILFDDKLYDAFNNEVKDNPSKSALFVYDQKGEKLFAASGHDVIDIDSIRKALQPAK